MTFPASVVDFEQLPLAALVLELDGTLVALNPAASRLVDAKPGDKVWRLSPPLEAQWIQVVPAAVLNGEYGAVIDLETRIGLRAMRLLATPRSHGDHRYILAIITDAGRSSEHEVHQASNQRLESLGLVAGGVAHEFNNQLVSVVADASTLREDESLTEDARAAVSRIEAAARRMTLLTRQLLAFAGRGRFVTALLDPDQLLAETRHRMTRIVPPTVVLELQADAGAVAIEADRGLLRQVILDLVENAADAVAGKGKIRVASKVSARDGTMSWELEVRDDGAGMDVTTLRRMFDPFFSTKPDHRGLGLSAVLGIVRRLGGDISASSEVGQGTVISVRLPIVPGVAPPRRRSTSEQPPMEKLTGLRILVADDEPSVRQTVQRLLVRRGAIPTLACDGGEAEKLLRSQRFDVMLFDVMMPVLTGYQLVTIARETQPNVPVILMSGYSEQARGVEPPDAFIEKPFDAAMLEGTIQAAVRGDSGRPGSE